MENKPPTRLELTLMDVFSPESLSTFSESGRDCTVSHDPVCVFNKVNLKSVCDHKIFLK